MACRTVLESNLNSMSEYLKVKRLNSLTRMDSSSISHNSPESNEPRRRSELQTDAAYQPRLSDVERTSSSKEQGYEYRSKQLFLEHLYGINTPEGQFNPLTPRSTFAEKSNSFGEDVTANRHQKQLLMPPSRYYSLQKQAMEEGGVGGVGGTNTGKGVMTCLVSSGATIKKCFNCPQCTYTTDRKNNLKRHLGTMHRDCGKTLQCCDATFASKAALREHIAWWHRAGYTCHRCVRSFSRKALLNRHLRVHDLLQRNGVGGGESSAAYVDASQIINERSGETLNDAMANSVDDVWFKRVTSGKSNNSSTASTKMEEQSHTKQPQKVLKQQQHQVFSNVTGDIGGNGDGDIGNFFRSDTAVAKSLSYRERTLIIDNSRDKFRDVTHSTASFESRCADWMSATGYEPHKYSTDVLSMRKDKINEPFTETFVDGSQDKDANYSGSSEDGAEMEDDLWRSVVLRRAFPRHGRARMIFYNRIPTTHPVDSCNSTENAQGPLRDEILCAKRTNIATVVNEIFRRRQGLAKQQTNIARVKTATPFRDSKTTIQDFDDAKELWRRKRMEDIVEETKQLMALASAKIIKCDVVRKLRSNASRLCVNSYRCDMCKAEFSSQVQLVEHECVEPASSVCIS